MSTFIINSVVDFFRLLNIANKGFPRSWHIPLFILFSVLVFTPPYVPLVFKTSVFVSAAIRVGGKPETGVKVALSLDDQPVVHTEEIASYFTDLRCRLSHLPGSPLYGFVYFPL